VLPVGSMGLGRCRGEGREIPTGEVEVLIRILRKKLGNDTSIGLSRSMMRPEHKSGPAVVATAGIVSFLLGIVVNYFAPFDPSKNMRS